MSKSAQRLRSVIDDHGYRANVGIILNNDAGRLLLAKRIGMDAWQFPQGGIQPSESTERAMYRELQEEVGLDPQHVEIIGCTRDWLRYELPRKFIRRRSRPLCIGQKQVWYLLRLMAGDDMVNLKTSRQPEFDHWRWVEFWEPLDLVIDFKREVYRQALGELAPLLSTQGQGRQHSG